MRRSSCLFVLATAVSVMAALVSVAAAAWTKSASVTQGALQTGSAPTGTPGRPTVTKTCLGSGHQYTLTFVYTQPVPNTNIKGYSVYYSTSNTAGTFTNFVVSVSGVGTLTATSPTLVWTVNTNYWYAVRATAGLWVGPFSTSRRFNVTTCP